MVKEVPSVTLRVRESSAFIRALAMPFPVSCCSICAIFCWASLSRMGMLTPFSFTLSMYSDIFFSSRHILRVRTTGKE